MHMNQSQETRDIKNFPRWNHKGENPTTSSETEWAPMVAVKPKDIKYDFQQLFSLSLLRDILLSHSCSPVEWVCVVCRNEELFIFFRSLYFQSNKSASLNNYLPGLTSLGESNNPSAPQLWGLYPPDQQGGLTSTQLWGLFPRLTMEG